MEKKKSGYLILHSVENVTKLNVRFQGRRWCLLKKMQLILGFVLAFMQPHPSSVCAQAFWPWLLCVTGRTRDAWPWPCRVCSFWIWLCSGFYYLLEAKFAGSWSFSLRVLLISASINLKQPVPTVHFPVPCFSGLAGKGITCVILQPCCHLPDISIESSPEKLVLLWFLRVRTLCGQEDIP